MLTIMPVIAGPYQLLSHSSAIPELHKLPYADVYITHLIPGVLFTTFAWTTSEFFAWFSTLIEIFYRHMALIVQHYMNLYSPFPQFDFALHPLQNLRDSDLLVFDRAEIKVS